MGHRLSKLYTRTGDAGTTGLGDGSRIDKDSLRMQAIGDVDELNCTLGLLLAEAVREDIAALLTDIQHDLFDLGGELSIPGMQLVKDGAVEKLEAAIDRLNEEVPPLKEFVLPGGGRQGAAAHLARAVCRRAERRVVTLNREQAVNAAAARFLNRLSDLLFVVARIVARESGAGEVMWSRERG